MERKHGTVAVTPGLALLFSVACGLAVANVYYAQPLLDAMAQAFGIAPARVGIVVTLSQVGYGLGLLLLVPLGDLVDRRRLIVAQSLLSVGALVAVALAPTAAVLLAGMAAIGLFAVVTQVLVAYAAVLTPPGERGRVVGTVTGGIVLGILGARALAGVLADVAGWRAIYVASALLTLVVAALLWRVLPAREASRTTLRYPQLIASVFALFAEERILRVRATIALLIFAAAMVLWTPMVLPLSAPPWSLSHTGVGLFGLAGAVGALAAARAGHWADRGHERLVSGASLAIMLGSWLPIALLPSSLAALTLGVVTLDLGLQAAHVANQSLIYAVRPDAHSRLTAAYMLCYSIGSAVGSIASTLVYARYGWLGVCTLGAGINAVALAFWWSTRDVTAMADYREPVCPAD